ncbi:MAG TPA: PQQ-dependent sugar dehydrogenase [Fimbriimonadaceae bacterium]|nr:PQQ-dependent sugar dehydrogenase [Fimbriimonadaceae bacterium]
MAKSFLALAAFGGAAFSWMCVPHSEAPSTPPATSSSQQTRAVNVTKLYNDYCSKCHGLNGEGGGGGTKSLNTREKYDQKWDKPFFDAIKNGVPDMGMDPYGQTLSDPEVWSLVVHLRELQYKALRAEESNRKSLGGPFKSKYEDYKIEEVIPERQGLSTPWSMDWLPDGRILITNRGGTLHFATMGKLGEEITGIPKSIEQGQGGLMEVAVHPDYKKNGWIYLTIADPAANGRGALTKVVRGKLKGNAWTSQETIWQADQKYYNGAGIHFGSKIAFDGKGNIFFSVGERGSNMGAQSLETPYGKIMRLKEDGKVPSDNPNADSATNEKAMWTYGHRNPQGLAFDSEGNLWDTEHGPRGGDEFNQIQKGANYGWPLAVWSINYNDSPFRTPWMTDGRTVVQPVFRWLPSTGASGLDLMEGSAFPKWKGDMFAGGLAGNNLDRLRVSKGKLVEHEEILWGMGRIRDIKTGPDGYLYIVLNGPDKVIRLVPAK